MDTTESGDEDVTMNENVMTATENIMTNQFDNLNVESTDDDDKQKSDGNEWITASESGDEPVIKQDSNISNPVPGNPNNDEYVNTSK